MKKELLLVAMMCLLIVGICGCSESELINNNATNISNAKVPTNEMHKNISANDIESRRIAVVYFSATGSTRAVAEYIKNEIDGDIFEIIPSQKYTAEDLNYGDDSTRATAEQHDKDIRPGIANEIDLSAYDVVFLGYPIWWGDTPRIIQTFIETGSLNGKTVIPFCTSGSSGIADSESTLKQYDETNWTAGRRFSSNPTKNEIKSWMGNLEILNTLGDERMVNEVKLKVNNRELVVELEDNLASKALFEKIKESDIVVHARDYGDFEKIGDLSFSLPREDEQITTEAGDIVLYQGNKISFFYNSNSWSYTKLGKIKNTDAEEVKDILGNGDVILIFSVK